MGVGYPFFKNRRLKYDPSDISYIQVHGMGGNRFCLRGLPGVPVFLFIGACGCESMQRMDATIPSYWSKSRHG